MTRGLTVATAIFLFTVISVVLGASALGRPIEIDGTIGGLLILMAGATFIKKEDIADAFRRGEKKEEAKREGDDDAARK